MVQRKSRLEAFLADKRRLGTGDFFEIPEFGGHIFGKIGRLAVNGELRPFFMVGQISRAGREKNDSVSAAAGRTGQLRPMLDHLEAMANKYGYDFCLYSVINEFLPDVCLRYGFQKHSEDTFIRLREWRQELKDGHENGGPKGGDPKESETKEGEDLEAGRGLGLGR